MRPEILAIAETVIGHHATGSVLRYMEEIVWSQIALIALDLDGTLLNSEKKITPHAMSSPRCCTGPRCQGGS